MQAFPAADAAGYERQMGRWSRHLAVEFAAFVGASDCKRILDVGCGTGHLAAVVAGRTPASTIVGIDLAAPYVEYAAKTHLDPRLSFKIGDACALPFASGTFDRVLALLVMHFLPRPLEALAEMQRVARAGAVLGAAVWGLRGGLPAGRGVFE
jgi:ubiquinone/menaquinone biosynthesis C-methylase UbiE